jgi:hypothetical protein
MSEEKVPVHFIVGPYASQDVSDFQGVHVGDDEVQQRDVLVDAGSWLQ